MAGLIGRKIGMTQIFEEDGRVVPVTVLTLGPCPIVQVRTDERDGYRAIQLGYDKVEPRKLNKPERGHLEKGQAEPFRVLREFRTSEDYDTGHVLDVTFFDAGDRVDVTGRMKGRGFQGVVRRHGFHGGRETHGNKTHDVPGSIGASASPSRVTPGKKLPGQMGDTRRTARNLKVVKIDPERHLMLVRGAVPGARNSLVMVRKTKKTVKG